MTGSCPYAHGPDPHNLTCDLAVAEDVCLPWWRRVVRAFAGRYDCPHFNGGLPCERHDLFNKEYDLFNKEDK